MSITQIRLENFKQFSEFKIHARRRNILVGPNNSGKSTILDALRLLHSCLRYARARTPTLLNVAELGVVSGYEIPDSWLSVPILNVARNYSDDPAVIEISHSNGGKIWMEFHPERASRFYFSDGISTPRTGTAFRASFPCELVIVPQLSPFEEHERYLSDETVVKNRSTRLSARHFRNIWYRSSTDEFDQFAKLVSASWPKVTIERPTRDVGDSPFVMMYNEKRIPREIFWSGYGFQVWLQLLMHILRTPEDAIFVIDEPDIYLHADLQKRLYRIIDKRFSQYFIATHSTEIINDAEIGSIVSIDRDKLVARRVNTDEQYQALYNYIGSSENAELAKLARAERIIFFEGEDKKILRKFAARTNYDTIVRDIDTVLMGVGGFSQWGRVDAVAWTLKDVLGIEASLFSIFDRDYRCKAELEKIRVGLTNSGIACEIWGCKEIENYALSIDAIQRLVSKKLVERSCPPRSRADIEADLLSITERYGEYVKEQCGRHARIHHKGNAGDAEVNDYLKKWTTLQGRLEIGPGKKIMGDLSSYYKGHFNISLTLYALIDELRIEEIRPDMMDILQRVDAFCLDEVTATLRAIDGSCTPADSPHAPR